MAFRSLLGSLVRGSTSPGLGIAVEETMGSAADRLRSLRNALFSSDGRKSPVAAAAGTSAFAAGSSRCLHSRARPRDGSSLPGIVVQGSLGSPAGREHASSTTCSRCSSWCRGMWTSNMPMVLLLLCLLLFSVIAGILHSMEDTDEFLDKAQKEDTPTKTDPYLRSHQLKEDLKREMASYNKTVPDEKTVLREYMEDDQAVRARFEEWMKEYGRTYKDEVEKARRFKIFKSLARFADAFNADAAKAGHSARFGLNEYSDWNAEEVARMYGTMPASRDGGYFKMVMSYLAPQGIWHQVGGWQCQ